jgi:hypothetical protein
VNDHSRHGAARAAGEHRYDLDRAAEHAGHGQGHEDLGHAGHANVYRRRFWITLILAVPVVRGGVDQGADERWKRIDVGYGLARDDEQASPAHGRLSPSKVRRGIPVIVSAPRRA